MTSKACHKCRITKPLETGFGKRAAASDGHNYVCKQCANIRAAKWNSENKDKVRQTRRTYYSANRAKLQTRRREWLANNPDKKNEYLATAARKRREDATISIEQLKAIDECESSSYRRKLISDLEQQEFNDKYRNVLALMPVINHD